MPTPINKSEPSFDGFWFVIGSIMFADDDWYGVTTVLEPSFSPIGSRHRRRIHLTNKEVSNEQSSCHRRSQRLYSMFDLILQFHGFEVTVVDDGRKAMEILKMELHLTLSPWTCICLAFPERRFTKCWRNGDAKHVLVVSAFIHDIKDFEIRGVNALEKPVAIDDLIGRVKEICEQKVPTLRR
jgi:hypothetical protein